MLDLNLIAVMAFTQLAPELLRVPEVKYLLSEVFSQDPLERYFSRQRHRGGHNDNPTAYQVPYNVATLQAMYRDLESMNVEASHLPHTMSQPLRKRSRNK